MKVKAKWLSIIAKVIAVLIAVGYNIFSLCYNKAIPSVNEQKSILLLCGAVIMAFSSIDISLIMKNIFTKGVNNEENME